MEHPRPVHALIHLRRQVLDFRVVEMHPAGQHAAEQQRCVDRGDLRFERALARVHFHEMIEKAVLVRRALQQESQCVAHTLFEFAGLFPAVLVGNTKRRQPESRRGNAGHIALVGPVRLAAVLDQAGIRVRLLPKEKEIGSFDLLQEAVVVRRESLLRRWEFRLSVPTKRERHPKYRGSKSKRNQHGQTANASKPLSAREHIFLRCRFLCQSAIHNFIIILPWWPKNWAPH